MPQGGEETDFILVSCAGGGITDPDSREKVLRAKVVSNIALPFVENV